MEYRSPDAGKGNGDAYIEPVPCAADLSVVEIYSDLARNDLSEIVCRHSCNRSRLWLDRGFDNIVEPRIIALQIIVAAAKDRVLLTGADAASGLLAVI